MATVRSNAPTPSSNPATATRRRRRRHRPVTTSASLNHRRAITFATQGTGPSLSLVPWLQQLDYRSMKPQQLAAALSAFLSGPGSIGI